jgi:RNA polymerase sigma-70 factor (ECF subfamily)
MADSRRQNRDTSQTLLEQLRANEPAAWDFMVRLYTPLLYHWIGRAGVQGPDAEDVCEEVLRVAATRLANYNRDRPGASFRGWLHGITRNMLLKHFERRGRSPEARGGSEALRVLQEHPESADATRTDFEAEKNTLYRRALELVQARFEAKTWEAFHLTVIEGRPPDEVAARLGISPASVRKYKCRVLHCLREEIGETIE